ncbi:MAG: hypothetical protein J1E99_01085 [Muribaculaceae bacterium]|nr:hypothetical protein [Muribaculaceae bacterium]
MSISYNYIDYWDDLIKNWANTGEIPNREQVWANHFKDEFANDLMPEPYWGNPEECSLVYIGYNPYGKKDDYQNQCHRNSKDNNRTVCGLLSPKYSEYAKKFPQLDEYAECPFGCYGGTTWWKERDKWFKRLSNGVKKPFVMELCAWHTPNWKNINRNRSLLEYVQENIIPVLKEAISNSDLKVGLSVGKEIGDILLNLDDDKWKEIPIDWQSLYKNHDISSKRCYRVLRSTDGYFMINTYNGRNKAPGEKFSKLELELLEMIKN